MCKFRKHKKNYCGNLGTLKPADILSDFKCDEVFDDDSFEGCDAIRRYNNLIRQNQLFVHNQNTYFNIFDKNKIRIYHISNGNPYETVLELVNSDKVERTAMMVNFALNDILIGNVGVNDSVNRIDAMNIVNNHMTPFKGYKLPLRLSLENHQTILDAKNKIFGFAVCDSVYRTNDDQEILQIEILAKRRRIVDAINKMYYGKTLYDNNFMEGNE